MLENLMGYAFLHSGFTADYKEGGQSFQLLLIEGQDAKDAETMLGQYLKAIKQTAAALKEGRFALEDPNQGPVSLSWTGKYLCVVNHLTDPKLREKYLTLFEASVHALN
jgi:hypothetical protein